MKDSCGGCAGGGEALCIVPLYCAAELRRSIVPLLLRLSCAAVAQSQSCR